MAVAVTIAFSANYIQEDIPDHGSGNGIQQPGGVDVVVFGRGEERIEITAKAGAEEIATGEIEEESVKGAQNRMNDVLLAFWHGVAVVLLGEAVALMIATAWIKIRKISKE